MSRADKEIGQQLRVNGTDSRIRRTPSRVAAVIGEGFVQRMETLIQPIVSSLGRTWTSFRLCGYVGLGLAFVLTSVLTVQRGMSIWVMWGVALASVGAFLALAMATKVLTGVESLTYYHHVVAVLAITAVVLHIANQPVLPYVDLTILGVGLFTACGRIGCLMVGCCHGRPARWGVRYGVEHAATGFPGYLVDVPLFPVQAVESLLLLAIVAVGAALLATGARSGDILTWYIVAYGVFRFCLEFARGDAVRLYLIGFSQAQWTSLILVCLVVSGELTGRLPLHRAHPIVAVGLCGALLLVAVTRARDGVGRFRLLHPRHVKEIAEALEHLSPNAHDPHHTSRKPSAPNITVARTSLGILLSADAVSTPRGTVEHWAISSEDGALDDAAARLLAELIARLQNVGEDWRLVDGREGVFHIVTTGPG
jgi:prolipoprotein diacylglyceryltransferase